MTLFSFCFRRFACWIEKAPGANLSLVAVADGQIVGDAGLPRFNGRQLHVATLGMGVHDSWTGRGVGTALLAALIDSADHWMGIWRLQLFVYVDYAPALRLYRRFGFEVEGTHRAYALRDGRYVDALAMARIRTPEFPRAASVGGRQRRGGQTPGGSYL